MVDRETQRKEKNEALLGENGRSVFVPKKKRRVGVSRKKLGEWNNIIVKISKWYDDGRWKRERVSKLFLFLSRFDYAYE